MSVLVISYLYYFFICFCSSRFKPKIGLYKIKLYNAFNLHNETDAHSPPYIYNIPGSSQGVEGEANTRILLENILVLKEDNGTGGDIGTWVMSGTDKAVGGGLLPTKLSAFIGAKAANCAAKEGDIWDQIRTSKAR